MSQTDGYGRSPLHQAALMNDVDAARDRLAAGDDPGAADPAGFTPLHCAAQEGSLDAARLLLDAGANVDAVDALGNTPLWVAVFNSRGEGDAITLLRRYGADPFKKNNDGQTPLGLARLIADFDVAQFFTDLTS
ncbi:MAG: ankyrin repeat domain-containing protein [Actinobacteria bacterium]|nr:MAG: ankyrin repeat domain-containing protein [Actinomycetota bacterium]